MNNLTLSIVAFALLFLASYRGLRQEPNMDKRRADAENLVFLVLVVLATAVKLWFAPRFYGHSADMSMFSAWADLGRHESVTEFYGELGAQYYVDYPPLYLYVLTFIGRLAGFLRVPFGSDAYLMMIKGIPILADTASAMLLYGLVKKKTGNVKQAQILAVLLLFNPAYWLNSVFWGQIDGLYTLIIVWLLCAVYNKQYAGAVIAFAVGMLTKPQMLIFAPLLGFWLLKDVLNEYKEEKSFHCLLHSLLGLLASLVLCVVSAIPIFGMDFGRFFGLYTTAAGQYPYASLNAANLFGAFGLNWASLSETFLGITYQSWGFIGIILTSVFVGLGTYFSGNRRDVFVLGGFLTLAIFILAHTMHERYMFPLLLILMFTYLYTEDKRVLGFYAVASVLCLIQCGMILLSNESIISFSAQAFVLLSWVQVLFFVALTVLWCRILLLGEIKRITVVLPKVLCLEKTVHHKKVTPKDLVLILTLTVVYGISAFANLGAVSVPQSGYFFTAPNETLILDLGDEYRIQRLNFHLGWIDRRDKDSDVVRDFQISVGIDPTNSNSSARPENFVYGDAQHFQVDSVFCWSGFFLEEYGRFIKLSVDEGNFYLNEIACFDENGTLLTPVAVFGDDSSAEKLFDEQKDAVYEFSWYEGTYFDEVYHPRTAYEYLNGLWPYENTHPPLGKIIISLGMAIFGVTPFGWRFFGTLCGVLMVPVVYLFAKRLFLKTKWAFAACTLFTFDFMHLSQTRLATIDSFTVLFVMLMFYFMYCYMERSFYDGGVKQTLPPLFFSGLCFGLGAAVKWQGIYAGAGLCILFFRQLYKRYAEYRAAKEGRLVGDSVLVQNRFLPCTIKTLVAGLVFFVFIPMVIYALSYTPIVLSDTADLSYIWENQKSMLAYHSQLTETHPYGSSWWSWPLDLRPLYAYSPDWDFIPKRMAQGISSFGNPLVWWLTIPAIGYAVYLWVKGKGNRALYTVLAGFGAMYLPWVLVPRQAFIYHFFPCVVFVVLATVYILKIFSEKDKRIERFMWIYLGVTVLLYVIFYPVLTGLTIPAWYAEALTWFPTWVLG